MNNLPTFPHGVTVESATPWTVAPEYKDFNAYRAGTREVARLTLYPDGRVYATRSPRVRGSLDHAAWAGIVRTLGGDSSDYYRGVLMPSNPIEH